MFFPKRYKIFQKMFGNISKNVQEYLINVAAVHGPLAYPSRSARPRPTKLCIRSTKCVHPTYTSCASYLQKLCIWPTESVHPTYKSCASDLQTCVHPAPMVRNYPQLSCVCVLSLIIFNLNLMAPIKCN